MLATAVTGAILGILICVVLEQKKRIRRLEADVKLYLDERNTIRYDINCLMQRAARSFPMLKEFERLQEEEF